MDTIPENQDFSEIDACSVYHQPASTKNKTSKKNEISSGASGRKVIMSKVNKPNVVVQKPNKVEPKLNRPSLKSVSKKPKKAKLKTKTCKNSHENIKKSVLHDQPNQSVQNFENMDSSMRYESQRQSVLTEEVQYDKSYNHHPNPNLNKMGSGEIQWTCNQQLDIKKG